MRHSSFIPFTFVFILCPALLTPGIGEEPTASTDKTVREFIDNYPDKFDDDGLGILSSPLKFCDLGTKLQNDNPITLFAPTNRAIRDLGKQRLGNWLIGAGKTYETLSSHIIAKKVTSANVEDQSRIQSLNGTELTLTREGTDLYVNDSKLVKTIECSNGVIHIIDRVLIPRASLFDTLVESKKYRVFVDFLVAAGLDDALKGDERMTVFAPTDEAFEKLPYSVAQMLAKPASKSQLTDILKYHVVQQKLTSKQFGNRSSIDALNGEPVRLSGIDKELRVNESNVSVADIQCTNGVVHEIESVLIPPDREAEIDEFQRRETGRQGARYRKWLAEKAAQELASLESSLEQQGIALTPDAIAKSLRQMTEANQDPASTRKFVKQLGSKYYAERVAAEKALMKLPVVPTELLREASQSSDFEQASRARKVLRDAIALQKQTVKQTYRVIELKTLPGLTNEILDTVARFPTDPALIRAAKLAVSSAVRQEDAETLAALVKIDQDAASRDIAVTALRRLQDPGLADRFDRWVSVAGFDESLRLECVLAMADLGDRRALTHLTELMVQGKSGSVRAKSAVALRQLTGKRFGFYVYASPVAREESAGAWRSWIEQEGGTAKLQYPLRDIESSSNGHTLVCYTNPEGLIGKGGVVIEYDESLNEVWTYECGYVRSAEKMENGNVLVAENNRVIEVTPEKEIVRQHRVKNVYSARPLSNGNFLVTHRGRDYSKEGGGAIEIAPNGEIVWEVATGGRWNEHAIRLKNGNTLLVEVGQQANRVIEYDKNGTLIWKSGESWSGLEAIQALDNGNVLVTILSTGAIEINKKSNDVVWRFPCEGIRDAYRTTNGNTLALTGRRIFEVDPNGVEIWSKDIQTVSGTIRR